MLPTVGTDLPDSALTFLFLLPLAVLEALPESVGLPFDRQDVRLMGEPVHERTVIISSPRTSYTRVRSRDTGIELIVVGALAACGLDFERHARDLPGKPDVIFREDRLAVFVDGDFWHGWHFTVWGHKLLPFWQDKIVQNRARDRKNFAKPRRLGWQVLRIWGHIVHAEGEACILLAIKALGRETGFRRHKGRPAPAIRRLEEA